MRKLVLLSALTLALGVASFETAQAQGGLPGGMSDMRAGGAMRGAQGRAGMRGMRGMRGAQGRMGVGPGMARGPRRGIPTGAAVGLGIAGAAAAGAIAADAVGRGGYYGTPYGYYGRPSYYGGPVYAPGYVVPGYVYDDPY